MPLQQEVRRNMHIVLSFSPVGDAFRYGKVWGVPDAIPLLSSLLIERCMQAYWFGQEWYALELLLHPPYEAHWGLEGAAKSQGCFDF
jgi:hypothetical protein